MNLTYCSDLELNNLCKLGSRSNNSIIVVNYLSGNQNPICGWNISGQGLSGTGTGLISLNFSKSSYILYTFVSSSIPAIVTGLISSCTSSPNLPSGLSLNQLNCEISGAPTSQQIATNYTITASNSTTSTSRTISRISGTTATDVYGQFGSFTCAFADNDGSCGTSMASSENLFAPGGIALDSSDNLYLADKST